MPATYVVLDELSLLVTLIDGDPPDAELAGLARAEHSDQRAAAALRHLVDLRGVTGPLPGHEAVKRLGEAAAIAGAGAGHRLRRTAIVAPQDHVYGVSRMFQAYAQPGGGEFEVFRNLDDAWEWLGVRPEGGELP